MAQQEHRIVVTVVLPVFDSSTDMKVAISLDDVALADVEKGHAINVVVLQGLGLFSPKQTHAIKKSEVVCTALDILTCLLARVSEQYPFQRSSGGSLLIKVRIAG